MIGRGNTKGRKEVDCRDRQEQQDKLGIPERVEVVARKQDANHCQSPVFSDGPIDKEDDSQEEPVLAGGE